MGGSVKVRPFRPEDSAHGGTLMAEPDGFTVVIDDAVAACLGLHRVGGVLWAFFEMKDERARKSHILHRRALALLAAKPEPVYAQRDRRQGSSGRWLTRLGFRPTGTTLRGYEVWQWPKSPRSSG